MATLKSRVSELEGSLNFAQENTNKVRKQALMDQEKLVTIMKEVNKSRFLMLPHNKISLYKYRNSLVQN